MVVIFDYDVESLVEGWGGLASQSPRLIVIDVFDEISHSCLEYGTGVIGWRDIYLIQLELGGMWNSHIYLVFTFIIEELIPLVFGMQMYWFLFGLYFYCIHCISVIIVLVISMYFIIDDVWHYPYFYM